MTVPTALDILVRARELPWCQGTAPGKYCLGMAIDRAAKDLAATEARDDAYRLTRRAIGLESSKGVSYLWAGIVHWNDAPGRTEAEARAVKDRAIELARGALDMPAAE